ncbi:MAG: glycosyltransferase [Parafilimonas sp.]
MPTKILIAPLDWGLGHATRCVVIIHTLQKLNCNVSIAASGKIKNLLQTEFPNINFLKLPGYKIAYSKFKRFLPFKILIQIPKILKIIDFENKWLNAILKAHNFNAIISDNRFGFYSKSVFSVFMTHQLQIKTNFAWLDKKLRRLNYNYINNFNECWVPDFEDNFNIAGELSHPSTLPEIPVKYLGPLSRFKKSVNQKIKFTWMAIISGPEPQRSLFEKKIFEVAAKSNDTFLIIRGLPGQKENDFNFPNCTIFNHLNTADMQAAIESSEFIISRCGYTTVMEILSLKKKSVLIPTPGQTEQEYLAKHLSKQNWCYTFKQTEDFITHLSNAKSYTYSLPEINMQQHEEIIKGFITSISVKIYLHN